MRRALVVAAVVALGVASGTPPVSGRIATPPHVAAPALERGAVYEAAYKVAWPDVEAFLAAYARWYLHADTAPGSGRRLLTVLLRELGDGHNLVFLYWYESPYKEQYYCKYAKAFFAYHLGNPETSSDLRQVYADAARTLGGSSTLEADLLKLEQCQANQVPPAAMETLRRLDARLLKLVVAEESSWNFGVNPCRAGRIAAAEKEKIPITSSALEGCERSLLEQSLPRTEPASAR